MKPVLLLAAVAAAFLFSCKNDAPKATADAPIEWQAMKLQEKICLSPKDTNRCASVNINLPVAAGGQFPAVAAAINDTLKTYAIATLTIGDGKPAATIEAAVKFFMGEYENFAKDAPDFPGGFGADVSGKALFNSSKVASVQVDNYINTGGAHPGHWTDLHTFDRKTGKTLGGKDLFTDPAAVAKMLEKPFCELRKEENGTVPKLSDLIFSEVQFGLPHNMAVVKEGIRFYYNPYELTAYALGDFDILLTWEQLGGLAKKEAFVD